MPKAFKPKIVSANDLLRGDVVYLDNRGQWSRRLEDASIAHTLEQAEGLLSIAGQPSVVVGPYLLDVVITKDGSVQPFCLREKLRDRGPTIRPDLGRQAGGTYAPSPLLVGNI